MRTKIVHDDDIAGLKDRHELLLDISAKALAIDWPIKDARRRQAVATKRAEECQRAPVAMGCKAAQAFALRSPTIEWGHVGLDPGFVDEDQPPRIEAALHGVPALSTARDVSAGLLKGEQRFF